MNKAHFKVKSITDLDAVKTGDIIPTSDFASLTPTSKFVQLEYVEEEDNNIVKFDVHPGIFTITKTSNGLRPVVTSFVDDNILKEFLHTVEITDKVDCFFRNIDKYKQWGIEVATRGILLYGPPGGGKSSAITEVIKKYSERNDTMILSWDTNKWEAYQVKDLIKAFNYVGVKHLILIIEDIGGGELSDRRSGADSSLLSLLDNQEKTFTIPTLKIATTNHPENFMAALTNRSGRFDDKIKIGFPPADARQKLLSFFTKGEVAKEALDYIATSACEKFPPAHIKEVVIRAAIHEKTHLQVMQDMTKEIKLYDKAFEDKTDRMGL